MVYLKIYVATFLSNTDSIPFHCLSYQGRKIQLNLCWNKQTDKPNQLTKQNLKKKSILTCFILLLCNFTSRKFSYNCNNKSIYYSVAQETGPLCSCQNILSPFHFRTLKAEEQQSQMQHPAASLFCFGFFSPGCCHQLTDSLAQPQMPGKASC